MPLANLANSIPKIKTDLNKILIIISMIYQYHFELFASYNHKMD